MGFLRRLIRPDVPRPTWPPPGPITDWPPLGGAFSPQIADRLFNVYQADRVVYADSEGEYQEARQSLAGGTPGDHDYTEHTSFFVPEPDNPNDPEAVRVCLARGDNGRWAVVGYLPRDDARAYRPAIDRLARQGQLLGGTAQFTDHRGSFGVSLQLLSPAALALKLDAADGIVPAAAAGGDGRPYATVTCPYCSSVLDPLPKGNKKKCPSCGETIHVVIDPADGIRLLLTEADAKIAKALIEADRAKESIEQQAEYLREELRGYITDGCAAVEVQVDTDDGEPCAACSALAGREFPIREAPRIPPVQCACSGGCACSYYPF